MASSSEKSPENQPGGQQKLRVSLPPGLIERLKIVHNWGERFRWAYDEEKIRRVWEIQRNMDFDDLIRHVMYGDGEEVVWEHDMWDLQKITRVPEEPQGPKTAEEKEEEHDDQPPSPAATDKPKDDI